MNMENARFNMIEQQMRPGGVVNTTLLCAFSELKRENFVQDQYKNLAFADLELPLLDNQKMFRPLVEGLLLQGLDIQKTDKVLEIGGGSGYTTGLLAYLADFVYSIEIKETIFNFAMQNLNNARINNVKLFNTNGIMGMPDKGPFDKIFIGGGLIQIPNLLKNQLKIGGKLVAIIGDPPIMTAHVITRVSELEYNDLELFETNLAYLVDGQRKNDFKFWYKYRR